LDKPEDSKDDGIHKGKERNLGLEVVKYLVVDLHVQAGKRDRSAHAH
jgi:hypothetical protein